MIQKSVNILQIHCVLSACPSQITSWKLIYCYKNTIQPKQKGIWHSHGVITKDSILVECCTLSTGKEQVIKE